jgi:hypothetical protein
MIVGLLATIVLVLASKLTPEQSDAELLQQSIDFAQKNGLKEVKITEDLVIDKTIFLPEGITLNGQNHTLIVGQGFPKGQPLIDAKEWRRYEFKFDSLDTSFWSKSLLQ